VSDPDFVAAFLLTYRSFAMPQELLDLLILRYNMPYTRGVDIEEFKRNKLDPIRLRVVNLLKVPLPPTLPHFLFIECDRDRTFNSILCSYPTFNMRVSCRVPHTNRRG
jgi:hypothetical protein